MDIKKMQAAAIALRDKNCEENYIEHINQSCPVNVLELIAQREMYARQADEYRQKYQREHIDTNRWKNRAELAEARIEVAENYISDKSADEVLAILSFDSAPAQSQPMKPGVAISLKGISDDDYNQFGALCILAGAEIGEFNRSPKEGYAYFGWSKNHGLYHSTSMIEFDDLIGTDELRSVMRENANESPAMPIQDDNQAKSDALFEFAFKLEQWLEHQQNRDCADAINNVRIEARNDAIKYRDESEVRPS